MFKGCDYWWTGFRRCGAAREWYEERCGSRLCLEMMRLRLEGSFVHVPCQAWRLPFIYLNRQKLTRRPQRSLDTSASHDEYHKHCRDCIYEWNMWTTVKS